MISPSVYLTNANGFISKGRDMLYNMISTFRNIVAKGKWMGKPFIKAIAYIVNWLID
jgi:hypothetical protein